jgi:2-polyprenyl-6-methoxyphenol hydroxylase-like FAD-dependent oxidoreductase
VLLDRAVFPADTLSTHQIARSGVVQLHRWGLLQAVLDSGAPAIRQVTRTAAGESVTQAAKHKAGVDLLVAPRRYILDTIVAEAAAAAGADLRLGVTVDGVRLDDTGRAIGVYGQGATSRPLEIDARYVVGADGVCSRVARSVGAPIVWICSPAEHARQARRRAASRERAFTATLDRTAPELAERLHAGQRRSEVTGMLRAPNYVRTAHGPGRALVGDAGHHRDPVTGHGLSDAYRDAELLAVALDQALRGDTDERAALAGYQRRRDQALRDIFDLTCTMAGYPPVPAFVELQKQLSAAIDVEAAGLAARSLPRALEFAPA